MKTLKSINPAAMLLVYKTDEHHSYSSRDIIGVCTDKLNALKIIRQQVEKEGGKLTKDDLYNLENISQTQYYKGEGEFQIEEIKTDILL